MCGIVGVVEYGRNGSGVQTELLKRMTDVVHHRGPDDEGHWVSESRRCGLGFRRLSIIDLSSAGHQPMRTADGRYTIVFNGEIYNHEELRRDLQSKGYSYSSKTDTESILYGFAEYGLEILEKMVGMWALAIWDDQEQQLFCSRDRIGIKPLYYYQKNGILVFGSEVKSILKHPEVVAQMNHDELPNYLCFSMSSERSTLFQGIHKVPAGYWMKFTKAGEVQLERYWSPLKPNLEWSTLDVVETQGEILRLLRQAVKARMMSDVPFGVFLSGGIDSSVNVALMSELMSRPVDTFTVGFKELEKYNELQYARRVSETFSTNHHEVLIDDSDAQSLLETMVWHEDEPNGDPVCIPLYFLSKLTRDSGTTVVQVGEGSDEQLVGYPWMLREWNFYNSYWKYFGYLPKPVRSAIHALSSPLFGLTGNYLAQDYLRRSAQGDELYWGGGIDITPTHQKVLFTEKHKQLASLPSKLVTRLHDEAKQRNPKGDYVQEMAFYELSHRLPELLLMRVDKLSMAHSLEARVPFLDHRLVEFTMSIPAAIKLNDRVSTKLLLKKAVEKILPNDIIYRRKQGFAAPVSEWFRHQWHDFALDTIVESKLVTDGVLSETGIKHFFDLHKSGKKNLGKSIYSLLNLALWHKKFIG